MLIETQVVRSKFELLRELQRLPVTRAVIYRNVDRKPWEQIAKEHQGVRVVVVVSWDLSKRVPVNGDMEPHHNQPKCAISSLRSRTQTSK